MSTLSGLDFAALQVRNLEASALFYEEMLGLKRAAYAPPHAIVFDTQPIPFAVREPVVDLDTMPQLGHGVALWFLAEDSESLLTKLEEANVPIVQQIQQSPFGNTFMFRDPDGYIITVHDKAG